MTRYFVVVSEAGVDFLRPFVRHTKVLVRVRLAAGVCRFANELLTAGLQQKDTNRTRSAIADALANMVAGLSKKTVTESAFWLSGNLAAVGGQPSAVV